MFIPMVPTLSPFVKDKIILMKTIVIASGYFDPIHKGHIEYLELAKKLGDELVAIVNNDEQAKLKKGKPFMKEDERLIVVKSLKPVDKVFLSIDKDSSVINSIRKVHELFGANIFAKGGDRFGKEIPEAKVCNELSIKIIDGLGEKIQSSSFLIKNAKD